MRKRMKNRRGFTITELAVVLAVLAIISTMVITFNSLVSNRRAASQARLDALNDIKIAEAVIEDHIEKNGITFDDNGNPNDISYADHILKVGERTVSLERVTEVNISSRGGDADKIYYCTLRYTIPGQDALQIYTFCVYPYVGKAVGGGAG